MRFSRRHVSTLHWELRSLAAKPCFLLVMAAAAAADLVIEKFESLCSLFNFQIFLCNLFLFIAMPIMMLLCVIADGHVCEGLASCKRELTA